MRINYWKYQNNQIKLKFTIYQIIERVISNQNHGISPRSRRKRHDSWLIRRYMIYKTPRGSKTHTTHRRPPARRHDIITGRPGSSSSPRWLGNAALARNWGSSRANRGNAPLRVCTRVKHRLGQHQGGSWQDRGSRAFIYAHKRTTEFSEVRTQKSTAVKDTRGMHSPSRKVALIESHLPEPFHLSLRPKIKWNIKEGRQRRVFPAIFLVFFSAWRDEFVRNKWPGFASLCLGNLNEANRLIRYYVIAN